MSGRVLWIGVRPGRREPVVAVDAVQAIAGRGLAGDRMTQRPHRVRQITVIAQEAIDDVARRLGLPPIDPAVLRRNVVVSGIDLAVARGQRLRLGEVWLDVTGPCDPCARMDEALGEGGCEAMRDLGGLTAVVLQGGVLRVGDGVTVELTAPPGRADATA